MTEPASFGPYRVLRPLARGGMAHLLLARKEGPAGFSKLVAVKQVLPHHIGNADFVKMFLDEARIAAQLDHPNIVHVQDFGEAGGTYYIAMEYLQGRDLTDLLRNGPIPPVIAALIGSAACSGLHYAHTLAREDGTALKIVHRDISPSNIFLTLQGAVKVLDFGIAKAEGKLSETKAGWLKGKPLYMSPEQIWSKPLDARSDVWALGVVLYELVTGLKPFERESERAIIEAIEKEQPPPLRNARPDVPKAFEDVVMKCLEKAPEKRFQSAQELRRALDAFISQHTSAPPQGQLQEFIEAVVPATERTPAPRPLPPSPPMSALEPLSVSVPEATRVDAEAAIPTVYRGNEAPATTQTRPPKRPPPQKSGPPVVLASLVVILLGGAGAIGYWLLQDAPPPMPPPVVAPHRPQPPKPASVVVEEKAPEPVVEDTPQPIEAPAPAPRPVKPLSPPKPKPVPAPEVTIPPPPAKAAAMGKLKVTCAPFGQLYIDGKLSGEAAPEREVSVEVGRHQVKCVHPDLGERHADVDVAVDQTVVKRLRY